MSTEIKAPRKNRRNKAGMAIAQAIIDEYQPRTAEDMQAAPKDLFGPMFESMLQGEMDSHLGYETNDHGFKATDNRRNGYSHKTVKTTYGDIPVDVPRDRDASFEPQAIPKRSRDVSGVEGKVLSMYAKGMSQRDIADTIEGIYGFEISHETISNITDRVIETAEEWQNRPLKRFYTFLFVDCLYVPIRKETETKNCAVYVILGYDVNGIKDILGLWNGEAEGKHYIKGLQGIYGADKEVYGASSLKAAAAEFERFKQAWSRYPGAVDVWVRNWQHVEQLFNYGSAVRKVMYTTDAIEAVNSSFRKVTKKVSFPSEDAVRKALYLRITEIYKKWNNRPIPNWAMVRNQLSMDDKIQARILKYENF